MEKLRDAEIVDCKKVISKCFRTNQGCHQGPVEEEAIHESEEEYN